MKREQYDTDWNELRLRAARLGVLALVLGLVCLVLALTVLRTLGMQRIVVTPPVIDRPFWVTHDKGDKEYLTMMAGAVCWLFLDATPESMAWKKRALLSMVLPEASGELGRRMDLEAERLRRISGATYFSVQELVPDEERQSVRAIGMMHTQINGHEVAPHQRSYLIQFAFRGGRQHIGSIEEEVPHAKP